MVIDKLELLFIASFIFIPIGTYFNIKNSKPIPHKGKCLKSYELLYADEPAPCTMHGEGTWVLHSEGKTNAIEIRKK